MKYTISEYKEYGSCAVLTNGAIKLIASLNFGPRIIYFGLDGQSNIFYEHPLDAEFLCTDAGWRLYGGLRLWFAPESEMTYWPDNAPVEYELLEDGLVLKQALDEYLGVRKEIRISFTDRPDTIDVEFEIENCSDIPLSGAPWAVTAVRPDGILHIPFSGEVLNMSPDRFLSLWGSTSLADERLSFTPNELIVKPLPMDEYFKIGVNCPDGYVRYDINGLSYIKTFNYSRELLYPDNNVNVEVYCCRQMMEIETLGALRTILPGEKVSHGERWRLFENVISA